jgi:peptidoglycan hydrolase CwlO-like protein
MKNIIFIALTLFAFESIAQSNTSSEVNNIDSISKKVENLQKKVDVQQEQILDLKQENQLLKKEVSKGSLFRRGSGSRSTVVVDRRGSKQAHVVYY